MKDDLISLSSSGTSDLIRSLADEIQSGSEPYTHILGVARGGLVPAVYLSHKLNLPMAITNYSSCGNSHDAKPVFWLDDTHVPIDNNSRVLVVDDIAETGNTLYDIGQEMNMRCELVHFLTLVYRQGSIICPQYIGLEIAADDPWVVFDWENI